MAKQNSCGCFHQQKKLRYTFDMFTGQPIGHDIEVGVCWGTKERDECSCGGDMSKCDFYKEVRQKARQRKPDLVEVVRCKDCAYWQDNNGGYPHEECRWGKDETPDADDYCSFGERKDGAE